MLKGMKIIICGYCGKMGQAVRKAAKNDPECEVVAGVDINSFENAEIPVYKNINEVKETADVVIDFSNPSALNGLIDYCKSTKTPAVICTTGLSSEQIEKIKEASEVLPIFYSRNMSLGVNLLAELSKITAKILGGDFDIEIIEKHHNQKIDAPSGTALMLAEEISSEIPSDVDYVFDRTKTRKPRSKNEIGIHSVRGGSIVGDHEVVFAGNKEIVSLAHHAESREIFANGAIKAAKFLMSGEIGFYTMKDMIKRTLSFNLSAR